MSDQTESSERANKNGISTVECLNLLALSEKQKDVTEAVQLKYPKMAPHPGSYYHKVYSTCGQWTGIEGVVTLGQPHLDPKRIHKGVAQDSFSTYLGGHAKQEIDAGLSWEVTRDKHGQIDREHKAWRPFWRNGTWHSGAAEPKLYWHPGDTVSMKLHVVSPNKLELTISDLGNHPKRSFSTTFAAKGFGVVDDAFFKRVDAIDQNGTEGKHVRKSRSHVDGTVWGETVLKTKTGSEQPLTQGFKRVVDDPPNHVQITSTHQQRLHGGEQVEIDATDKRK
ncbi:hypothetical protein BH10CYA1_BH10CYA1_29000 [soil metagenome]